MSDLRSRLNLALASGHLPQLRHQRNGRHAICEGVILSASNVPGPIFNTAAVLEPTIPAERAITIASEFFGTDRRWGVLVEAGAGHPIEATLIERGWRVVEETPAMLLSPIPEAPRPAPGIEIRRVVDHTGFNDYLAPLEMTPPDSVEPSSGTAEPLVPANVDRLLLPSLAIAEDPDVALLVGYVEGVPRAGAALYRTDGVAEIGGVAVAPSWRRRGFGAALTWAAISEGAARGCDVATLHSSAMGYPLYSRMGFRPFVVHRRYALRAQP